MNLRLLFLLIAYIRASVVRPVPHVERGATGMAEPCRWTVWILLPGGFLPSPQISQPRNGGTMQCLLYSPTVMSAYAMGDTSSHEVVLAQPHQVA